MQISLDDTELEILFLAIEDHLDTLESTAEFIEDSAERTEHDTYETRVRALFERLHAAA